MVVNPLVVKYGPLLLEDALEGPVLDLACGEGENGLYLAEIGLPVILADRSGEALEVARRLAGGKRTGRSFVAGGLRDWREPV